MKKITCFLLVASFFQCFQILYGQDTTYYSVVIGKDISGIQKTWMNGNNEYHFFYQYNDRGRGDSIYEELRTGKNGLITRVKIHGVDYFKNSYHETYDVSGDSSFWIVNDQRTAKLYRNELYVNLQAPGVIEPVIKALLQQPDKKAPAFNGGNIQLMPLHTKVLTYQGKPLHLVLCEMNLNENQPPVFMWLNDQHHFFANVSDWSSTIQKGFESLQDTLVSIQETQSMSYYTKQMDSLSRRVPGDFAITHVRIFDAEHAVMLENMTVMVRNGMVTQIGSASEIKIPKLSQVINATGKTLMPGLWDMHGHYDKTEGLFYLAGGVTHVRDMGNSDNLSLIRDAIRRNELLGPDISYMSGFIDQAGPFQGPTGAIIHSLEEGLQAVDNYAKRGYQQIKLYSSIDPKWVAPLATAAHQHGMRVAGHIPSFMTATQAVNDGYNEITHMNMVMLNFLGDTIDTRSRGRFYAVGQRAKNIDLSSRETADFINLLKKKDVSIDPTMNVFCEMFTLFPGDTNASIKPIVAWLPVDQREDLAAQASFAPQDQKSAYAASFEAMMQMLKKLYDAGILIVSGTDGGESFALEHELELYVQAGIPPLNALQTATWNAAKDCNLLKQYGSISEGKTADMILINGNPSVNISDIRKVEWVIKNDRWYIPKQLLGSQGWNYYY